MNAAAPQLEFDTDLSAIEGFATLLKEGFENPENVRARVRISVPEYPRHGFIARYGATLTIEPDDPHLPTDTQVSIPIATMHRIFREFMWLDWRDPEIIGTLTFTGNLAYANHLAKSCIRPSSRTTALFRKAARLHAAKGYRHLSEVEYLHQPTQRQVLEAIEDSRPVVITGLEPEPPCRDWTLDRLVRKYGDEVVRVRSATDRQTMSDFVDELKGYQADPYDDLIEGFAKPYTEGARLPHTMMQDFGPVFFEREDFIAPQLWLGAVPTHIPTSSLHRDPLTGFLMQVIGRKTLELYSADQADLIYPIKSYNNYQPCWFKPEAPDYTLYPKAREARSLSVTLQPGEVLVQPAGWFHQVYARDSPNMSVSYFWRY